MKLLKKYDLDDLIYVVEDRLSDYLEYASQYEGDGYPVGYGEKLEQVVDLLYQLKELKSRSSESLEDREIDRYTDNIIIIAHKRHGRTDHVMKVLVDPEELDWRENEKMPIILTLREIGEQLLALGYEPPFYVWEEGPLEGTIYQYGNYDPPQWLEHGQTKGFA